MSVLDTIYGAASNAVNAVTSAVSAAAAPVVSAVQSITSSGVTAASNVAGAISGAGQQAVSAVEAIPSAVESAISAPVSYISAPVTTTPSYTPSYNAPSVQPITSFESNIVSSPITRNLIQNAGSVINQIQSGTSNLLARGGELISSLPSPVTPARAAEIPGVQLGMGTLIPSGFQQITGGATYTPKIVTPTEVTTPPASSLITPSYAMELMQIGRAHV